MSENKPFTDKQYGFMNGRSTALQLLRVLDEWTEALDAGKGIDCIYVDYQKAFDTVPHMWLVNLTNLRHTK
jgi:sarcosine oxidase/L-pipecolate oxidase